MKVEATDADMGINAVLVYRIEKGGFDDFTMDNQTGEMRVATKLDYDLRNSYNIHVIAVDGGEDALEILCSVGHLKFIHRWSLLFLLITCQSAEQSTLESNKDTFIHTHPHS